MSRLGRRPAWLNRKFGKKKRVCDLWKGWVTEEDYEDVVRLRRDKIRRAEAQLELHLAAAVTDNKKDLYKYVKKEN